MVHSERDFDDISREFSPIYHSYTDGPLEDVKAWLPQLEEAYPGVEDLKASLADNMATLPPSMRTADIGVNSRQVGQDTPVQDTAFPVAAGVATCSLGVWALPCSRSASVFCKITVWIAVGMAIWPV
jgi:hypothetical protein